MRRRTSSTGRALVAELGPRLEPGDEVLDLACGDGGFGEHLLRLGLRYRGVDSTPEMVAAAEQRLAGRAPVEIGDLNDYAPPAPVAATTCFRAIYYASDRREFFRHAASYTTRKLVFDLNPRQYPVEEVVADLRAAGLRNVDLAPVLRRPRPGIAGAGGTALLRLAERSGPRGALRPAATASPIVVAASRSAL